MARCLTGEGKHWTQRRWAWIRHQRFDLPPLQPAFEAPLVTLGQALARLAELEEEGTALAESAPPREPVQGLRCSWSV